MMGYDVTLKMLPERYVASTRQVIPSYEAEGQLWQTMMGETGPLRIQPASPGYTMAIFHDGEYKEHDVDVEIQMAVNGHYQDTEHVTFKTVPAVQVASATFKGGYDQIALVNEAVGKWLEDNGYEYAGESFCIYHVGMHVTQNPDELVTEVGYPVVRR